MVKDRLVADLRFVKRLASEAAQAALLRAQQVAPQEKANQSYVTDLDHDLERLIRARLAEAYPDDLLTGEEYAEEGGKGGNDRRWSIDPIDGTGNLVHRLPLWAISIGLLEAGEPVLGVIAIPPLGEMYWAIKGGGAWRDGNPLEVTDADTFHSQDNLCVGTNALRALDPRTLPGRLRDLGSACCEQSFVAAGRLAACTFLGEALHDLAAGAVITAEAGCRFGTVDGQSLTPAEFVAQTPVPRPTFVAPPRRLEFLMKTARMLEETSR
jgi:fructose-1,6-bisphosphatase/inositol monophosphatase family enzyme